MSAEQLYHYRRQFHDGAILEVVIWRLPKALYGSTHSYKYRLFYGYSGQRVVGYDNERGKGDHRHYDDSEEPYVFSTPEQLIEDFLNDVQHVRKIV